MNLQSHRQPAPSPRNRFSKRSALFGAITFLLAIFACEQARAQLIIGEFRLRGPNGANDEFIELINNSNAVLTVAGGGSGYALAASDGVIRAIVPNGTVIPAHGHYLMVNSVGYSLASYPAGNGTTATGDATYTTDIPDNVGIALFNTTVPADFTLANRLDAAGSVAESNTLYKEGTGYPTLQTYSIDYSWYRDSCGKGGSISNFSPCTQNGIVKDTDNNAADFVFQDTNGTSEGAGQRLGAPGPENLSGPVTDNSAPVTISLLDSTVPASAPPNRVRDTTPDSPNNSTEGTYDIRRVFTNTTGVALTRLRLRIIDITTFPAPNGIADLRARTSTAVVVSGINDPVTCGASPVPCSVTVQGTSLEQPPSQPNGGAFNSSDSAGTVTLATPLAPGASVALRFLLGAQQDGAFRFAAQVEALPKGGGSFEDSVAPATDLSITKSGTPDPVDAGSNLTYTIKVSNSADADAINVSLADVLPANTTFVSFTAPAGWTATTPLVGGTGTVTATTPSLAASASATFTLVVKVDDATPNGTIISNTATVSSDNTDTNPANNSAPASNTVGTVPPSSHCGNHADGSGSINSGGAEASFAFSLQSPLSKKKNHLVFYYRDPAHHVSFGNTKVKSLTISCGHARFSGSAKFGKHKTVSFTADAYDNGDPGTLDEFTIHMSNGYSVGGNLTSGNIRIY